jgi:hypothetical protein
VKSWIGLPLVRRTATALNPAERSASTGRFVVFWKFTAPSQAAQQKAS